MWAFISATSAVTCKASNASIMPGSTILVQTLTARHPSFDFFQLERSFIVENAKHGLCCRRAKQTGLRDAVIRDQLVAREYCHLLHQKFGQSLIRIP